MSRTGQMAGYLKYRKNLPADWQKQSSSWTSQVKELLFNSSFLQDFNEQDKNSKDDQEQ